MNPNEHIEFGELASFALHTLEEGEAAAMAHHVRSCSVCQSELAKIREDLGRYARLTRVHGLPEESRQKILDQVAQEKRIASRVWPVWTAIYGVAKSVEEVRSMQNKPRIYSPRHAPHSVPRTDL